MPKRSKPLGRQILNTLDDLVELMGATTDADRLKELNVQYDRLRRQLGDLVEKNLDQASQEYREATKGLQEASSEIRKAIKGIESVSKAIAAVGRAVDLISRVA